MIASGTRFYGLAAILLGLAGLAWGEFAAIWQPVPAETPGRTALAYAAGLLFVAGGVLLQVRRTATAGAWLLVLLHIPFALLWAKRVAGGATILATWLGFFEALALILGGLAALVALRPDGAAEARRLAPIVRMAFGACLLVFGAAHFLYVTETAAMVPAWLPPNGIFWAYTTGACHILAGLALLSGVQALLAAQLLVAMFLGFGLLVWAPQLVAAPHLHVVWAGNAINLALAGAAGAVASMLRGHR